MSELPPGPQRRWPRSNPQVRTGELYLLFRFESLPGYWFRSGATLTPVLRQQHFLVAGRDQAEDRIRDELGGVRLDGP